MMDIDKLYELISYIDDLRSNFIDYYDFNIEDKEKIKVLSVDDFLNIIEKKDKKNDFSYDYKENIVKIKEKLENFPKILMDLMNCFYGENSSQKAKELYIFIKIEEFKNLIHQAEDVSILESFKSEIQRYIPHVNNSPLKTEIKNLLNLIEEQKVKIVEIAKGSKKTNSLEKEEEQQINSSLDIDKDI